MVDEQAGVLVSDRVGNQRQLRPDENSLYYADLRNLLMRLALADTYRARWSDQVQQEWTDALARNRPDLPRAKIDRVRLLMEPMFLTPRLPAMSL